MIENYSITEWIAFFFIYSFLGWCIESAIVSFNKRKLTNRGFLKGPMLPLYGSGAVIMLLSTLWAKDNYVLVYICGTIGATALEYVTGVLMEMMFNMRYWDYSNKKFQIHGYICLTSSLFWGVLTVLLVCFVHIPVAALVASVPANILRVGLFFIIAVASVDTVDAFKKALDFQKLLTYETRIKNELSELTERLMMLKVSLQIRTTSAAGNFQYAGGTRRALKAGIGCGKGKGRQIQKFHVKQFPVCNI